jgi:beta-galactosidase
VQRFPRPKVVLSGKPSLDVDCFLAGRAREATALSLEVELRDGERTLAKGTVSLTATHPRLGSQKVEIALTSAPAEMI